MESRADITERTQKAMKKLDELGGPVDLEAAYNAAMGKIRSKYLKGRYMQ